ncbi:MAG: GNAT family N-acetyltransferase [Acetobacteraceae bacterium]
MTTPYTCVYKPVLTADLSERNLQAVARALGAYLGRSGLVRVDALPIEWPMLSSFVAGLRDSGLRVLPFDHFGNWYEDVADDRWDAYLAARPGALRETIRRRLRRADRLASARFTLLDAPGDVAGGVSAYEAVYERSWKEPEPFPRFNGTLMHAFAQDRTLRLGLWFVDDAPAAAQFWVVRDGYATVLKLAHDEAFKAHSPGTVLSSLMIRHLLDRERVRTLDFGRGDDPYKQGWVGSRRQRIGLMLANPWSAAGQAAILRATLARARNRLLGG